MVDSQLVPDVPQKFYVERPYICFEISLFEFHELECLRALCLLRDRLSYCVKVTDQGVGTPISCGFWPLDELLDL